MDTMIVQAIGLLDDLDKELNTYAMRVREWYGWHFPEMTRVVSDNIQYALVVRPSTLLFCFESHAQSSDVAQSCIPARCGMLGTAPFGAKCMGTGVLLRTPSVTECKSSCRGLKTERVWGVCGKASKGIGAVAGR